jgi:hypothetical protein
MFAGRRLNHFRNAISTPQAKHAVKDEEKTGCLVSDEKWGDKPSKVSGRLRYLPGPARPWLSWGLAGPRYLSLISLRWDVV